MFICCFLCILFTTTTLVSKSAEYATPIVLNNFSTNSVCSLGRLRPTILRGYNYVSMPHPRYWFNWPLLVKGTLELHWLCFEPQPYFQANVFRYANARLYTIKLSKLYKFGIQAHHRVSQDIHWAVFEYESHVQESRQYAVEQRTLQVNYIHGPLLKISSEATPSWGHEILNISIDCCGNYLPITATTFTVFKIRIWVLLLFHAIMQANLY